MRVSITLAVAILLTACGSRSGLADPERATDAGVASGCRLPSAVRGVVGRAEDGRCVLEGRSADGRTHRMTCATTGTFPRATFAGCRWVTDGVTVCECDAPDWANTCPGSVPICLGWNRPFDFATDVRFE
jgi:hypothetical protein